MARISSQGLKEKTGALLMALVGGLLLLGLSVPRTVVAVIGLPGDVWLDRLQDREWLDRIQDREDLDPEQLEVLIGTREAALKWVDSSDLRNDLALASLWHAIDTQTLNKFDEDDGHNRAVLQPSIDMLHDSLRLGPSDPYGWHQLAFAEFYAGGISEATLRALEMSIRTGPNEPRLRFERLELALICWPALDPDLRALVEDQIRIAWSLRWHRVVHRALRTDRAVAVRKALSGSRDALIEFEEGYDRHVQARELEALEEQAERNAEPAS